MYYVVAINIPDECNMIRAKFESVKQVKHLEKISKFRYHQTENRLKSLKIKKMSLAIC